jgi:hypothetical protein
MINIAEITSFLSPLLKEDGFNVEEIKWLSKENVLQVVLSNQFGEMDLDACTRASEIISSALDKKDPIKQEYNLEVCSPGAEKEIKDIKTIVDNTYVYIEFKKAVDKYLHIEGYWISEEGNYFLIYHDKAKKKKMQIESDNIAFIRHAVKI